MNIFLNNVHWYKTEVLASVFTLLTHKSFLSSQFTANNIKSIIKKIDPNNAHGDDRISIRMIKLCGDSIYKILFKPRYFSSRMEKSSYSASV